MSTYSFTGIGKDVFVTVQPEFADEHELMNRIDKCVHGDFQALLGDRVDAWFSFVNENIMADGVLMEVIVPTDEGPLTIWVAWSIIYPDKINCLGLLIPNSTDNFNEKPDEYISWNSFRVSI